MSSINTLGIDVAFPVEGEDNDSQTFRDNFAAIKAGLDTAALEITALEASSMVGYTGSSGLGYTGSVGYSGSASSVAGPQGPQGLSGYSGSVGSEGPQGPAGGPQGPQGSLGYSGSSGVGIGIPGDQGYTGSVVIGYSGSFGLGYSGSVSVGYTGSASATSGDVVGPASSTANRIAVFANTSGKLLSETTASITSAGAATFAPNSGVGVTITSAANTSALVANGAARTPAVSAASGTTINIDCSASNVFYTNIAHNVTTVNFNNPTDGQTINWFVIRPASPTYTVTLPTTLLWPNATAGAISTSASATVDLLVATYLSATSKWYVTLLKNFA